MSQDVALRYMTRYHCIGTACENNCCWGWRIGIDRAHYDKLRVACKRSARERDRFERSLELFKRSERTPGNWAQIRLRSDRTCPMLEEGGLCHIHGTYGESYLSDTCAIYPRKLKRFDKGYELTGMVSCPEIARQLLLTPDAADIVPFDRKTLPRKGAFQGLDSRDARPYWRYLMKVREWVTGILAMREHSIEERLFLVTYLAKQSVPHFYRAQTSGEPDELFRQMKLLQGDSIRQEIVRRFNAFETPHSLVVLLARELLRVAARRDTRSSLHELGRAVFETYGPEDWKRAHEAELDPTVLDSIPTRDILPEYRQRKALILERVGGRIDQYLTNFAIHYWVHNWHVDSPDLLVHTLRLLGEMAIQKFLLFSHPRLAEAVSRPLAPEAEGSTEGPIRPDDLERSDESRPLAPEAEGSTEGPNRPDDLERIADEVAVEVFYKSASFIEHGYLLRNFERSLETTGLRSLAGAIYLVKF